MNNFIKFSVLIVFITSIFGYMFFSSIGVILNFDNRQIIIPYRAMVGLVSLILFLLCIKGFSKNINNKKKIIYFFSILFFISFFILRSFLDSFFYLDNLDLNIKIEYWLFTIFVTLLPATAFALGFKYANEHSLVKWGTYVGLISVLTSIISYLGTVAYDLSTIYSGRISLSVLNPITIGHGGLSLILLSYVFLTKYSSASIFNSLIGNLSYLVGFVALIAAGSRGPFLSLIVCVLFIFLLKDLRFKSFFYITLILVFLLLIVNSFDIYIYQRLSESFFEDEGRDSLLQDSFIMIRENFFIGSGIFPLESYPHNLIVEAFLVLGLPGLLLFFVIFVMNLYYAVIIYRKSLSRILPLLYIQYCVFSMVSSTLNEALMFWMLTFCFLFFKFDRPSRLVVNKE